MEAYFKPVLMFCGYVLMGSIVVTMVLSPMLATKGVKRYPRADDVRQVLQTHPEAAWICRTLLWARIVRITTAAVIGVGLAALILWAVFKPPGN